MDDERHSQMPGGADDRNFTYDAFISYRHVERDRKWAEWLIASLEAYRVPKSLQDRGVSGRGSARFSAMKTKSQPPPTSMTR